jgi:hypothetical protein
MRYTVQLRVRGQLDSLSTRRTAAAPPAVRKLSSMGPLYGQAVLRANTALTVGSFKLRSPVASSTRAMVDLKISLHHPSQTSCVFREGGRERLWSTNPKAAACSRKLSDGTMSFTA